MSPFDFCVLQDLYSDYIFHRRNFPNVAVHNQCANIMMRYSIKEKEGHRPDAPRQLFDENMAIPGPIKPPRCIACGFPWSALFSIGFLPSN